MAEEKEKLVEFVSKTKDALIDFSTLNENLDDDFIKELVYPLSEYFDTIPQGGSILDTEKWGYNITVNRSGDRVYVLSVHAK